MQGKRAFIFHVEQSFQSNRPTGISGNDSRSLRAAELPRHTLRAEHGVQGGGAVGGRADVQDERVVGPPDFPAGPRAAGALYRDQVPQLSFDGRLGAEAELKAVGGLGAA